MIPHLVFNFKSEFTTQPHTTTTTTSTTTTTTTTTTSTTTSTTFPPTTTVETVDNFAAEEIETFMSNDFVRENEGSKEDLEVQEDPEEEGTEVEENFEIQDSGQAFLTGISSKNDAGGPTSNKRPIFKKKSATNRCL